MHARLLTEHGIEVPVYAWPHTPTADVPRRRLLRISAQLYNDLSQYERLAEILSAFDRSINPRSNQIRSPLKRRASRIPWKEDQDLEIDRQRCRRSNPRSRFVPVSRAASKTP